MKLEIQKFTFNPFQENSYIIYNELNEAVIIDPGCYSQEEKVFLKKFIDEKGLEPLALLNTHCHIDHVLGNAYVKRTFNTDLYIHKDDLQTLKMYPRSAETYGFEGFEDSPEPDYFIEDNQILKFGEIELKVIFGPGHAPGHVAFYNAENNMLVGGDILFQGSFGRVDLPGGNMEILKQTIHNRIFTLPDETIVHPGHGPFTTIKTEKQTNYILQF